MKTTKLNVIDKTIAFFSPGAGVKRSFERQLFEMSYDAANPDRGRAMSSNPFTEGSSESASTQRDRIKMMWEARNLAKNYSFVKSVLMKESLYTCGRIQYQAQTGDPQMDDLYESYFNDWTKRCDLTGRNVFRQMIQLGHMGMRRDGQHGWVMVPQGADIKLQAIEGDRIGNPIKGTSSIDDRDYNGIKVNNLGQITNYELWARDKNGQYKNPKEVPVDSFIHYLDPMRSDQYHGITAFDTCIPHARNIHDLYRYETMAVKWGSAHTGIITKDKKDVTDWKTSAETTGNGTIKEKVEPGTVLRLDPGENVSMFQTSMRPSPTFNGFIEALIREMANGLNLPFSFVWDMAALGGVSARIELAMAQRTFKRSQLLLEERVLNPIKDAVISRAITYGQLPSTEKWNKCKWQFPAHITADQGYTTQSDIALMQNGLKTGHDIVTEMGGDYEETVETLAREAMMNVAASEEQVIPIEVISQRYPNATQQIAMMRQQMMQADMESEAGIPVGQGEGEQPEE